MKAPASKIVNLPQAIQIVQDLRVKGLKTVFTNGCFDILHKGHVSYLFEARSLGDFLIVGLNADTSVQALEKSPARPLQNQDSRAFVMASLACVDLVVIFDEPTPFNLINALVPHILVKGADYKKEDIVGYSTVVENGGDVVTIPFIEGYSTSAIERKIIAAHQS